MTTVNNDGLVHSVANQLTNHGNIYHGPVNNVHYANLTDQLQLELTDPATKLDNDILGSLAFPEMFTRRSNVTQAHPNTCEWILDLEQYKSWANQPHGLLWIKGKPGAGKSTLMAFLYRRLEEEQLSRPDISITFFFSARGAELERTPVGMLRSLLNQLFRQDCAARDYLRDFYKSMIKSFGHGPRTWEWQRMDLEKLLEQTVMASAQRQQINIFVDALDEAGELTAREVARYFHRLNDSSVTNSLPVKTCISCRHYPITAIIPGIEVCVEDYNGEDIASFVHDRLRTAHESVGYQLDSKHPSHGSIRSHDDQQDRSPWVEFETYLISRARGVFQWVYLVLPMLEQYMLAGDSLQDIRRWLQEVPAELKDVYEHIIRNVIDRKHRVQSFLLFQWICLAARPLSVTEMRYALAASNVVITLDTSDPYTKNMVDTDERMVHRVKALSGGLAEAVAEKPSKETTESRPPKIGKWRVQIVHQSVNEFFITVGLKVSASLASHSLPLPQRFDVDGLTCEAILSRCHAILYRSCLKCVVLENMKYLDSDESYPNFWSMEKMEHWSWMCYAVDYMFIHAEKAGEARYNDTKHQIRLMEEIIEYWTDVSLRHNNTNDRIRHPPIGTTVLHAASAANLLDIVGDLARAKGSMSIGVRDIEGSTALHVAAREGHIKVVDILLKAGADARAKNKTLETPLLVAAYGGRIGATDRLLKAANNAHERAMQEEQVLQAAAKSGHVDLVEHLLATTTDTNGQYELLGSALQEAAHEGHERTVQILLEAGADVHAQSVHLGNALQAAAIGGTLRTLQILLDAGADVNAQGGEYGNALQAALIMGSAKKVELLLDFSADIHAQGGKYGSAIQAALATGNLEMARRFLDAGVDVNVSGGYYGNALQAASYTGDEYTVQRLLDAGAKINARGGEYGNALQAAAAGGSADVVRLLLEAGADVTVQGGCYGGALHAARENCYDTIAEILLEAGKKAKRGSDRSTASDYRHKSSERTQQFISSDNSQARSSKSLDDSSAKLSDATASSDNLSGKSRHSALQPLSKLFKMTRQGKG